MRGIVSTWWGWAGDRWSRWARTWRRPRGRLPIWVTGPFWVLVVAWLMVWVVRYISGQAFVLMPWPLPELDTLNDTKDVLQTSAGVFALVGAVLTAVYSYRKQSLEEAADRRADEADRRADELELSRRYEAAAGQLGDEKAAVRIAGVYAMARLADDWDAQRQTCIDVLCAYLRMPPPAPRDDNTRDDLSQTDPERLAAVRQEDEVRDTVQRLIETHLKPQTDHAWSDYRIDLTGAHLHNTNLDNAKLPRNALFMDATFTGAARFEDATFTGDAWFQGATFARDTTFEGATFNEEATFRKATFNGNATFWRTTFTGDAKFGSLQFGAARFTRAAWFQGATFTQAAGFQCATFTGDAWFQGATFTRDATFGDATFTGAARFEDATFTGNTWFEDAKFSVHPSGLSDEQLAGAMVKGQRVEGEEGDAT